MRKILLVMFVLVFLAGCAQMGAEEIARKIQEK